jgi:hypothetical protein
MDNETWLPVPGFEGFYEANEDRMQVRSVDRVITDSRGQTRHMTGKILYPLSGNVIQLHRDGQSLKVDVKTVVARTFALVAA